MPCICLSTPLLMGPPLLAYLPYNTSSIPLSLNMRAENALSLPHNNTIYSLTSHPLNLSRLFPKGLKNLPFGYRADHKVRPKITGQHAFEVLFSQINNSSLPLNHLTYIITQPSYFRHKSSMRHKQISTKPLNGLQLLIRTPPLQSNTSLPISEPSSLYVVTLTLSRSATNDSTFVGFRCICITVPNAKVF